jgi:hypothetical protein
LPEQKACTAHGIEQWQLHQREQEACRKYLLASSPLNSLALIHSVIPHKTPANVGLWRLEKLYGSTNPVYSLPELLERQYILSRYSTYPKVRIARIFQFSASLEMTNGQRGRPTEIMMSDRPSSSVFSAPPESSRYRLHRRQISLNGVRLKMTMGAHYYHLERPVLFAVTPWRLRVPGWCAHGGAWVRCSSGLCFLSFCFSPLLTLYSKSYVSTVPILHFGSTDPGSMVQHCAHLHLRHSSRLSDILYFLEHIPLTLVFNTLACSSCGARSHTPPSCLSYYCKFVSNPRRSSHHSHSQDILYPGRFNSPIGFIISRKNIDFSGGRYVGSI